MLYQMVRILSTPRSSCARHQSTSPPGAPLITILPLCRGCSLREAVHTKQGELQGYFPLQTLMRHVRHLTAPLSADRTPNIVRDALSSSAAETTVTRHGNSNTVPTAWLRIALVFCERRRLAHADQPDIEHAQDQAHPSDELEAARRKIATLERQLAQSQAGGSSYSAPAGADLEGAAARVENLQTILKHSPFRTEQVRGNTDGSTGCSR